MTVGISFTNGLEAVVIADSRASGLGRESDSVEKLGVFSKENYHGVIFGSGDANKINFVLRNLNHFKGDNLEDYVGSIVSGFSDNCDFLDKAIVNENKNEIIRKSSIFLDEKDQINYINGEIKNFLNGFSEHKKNDKTNFIMISYDKNKDQITQQYFQQNYLTDITHYHLEIGSGSDGANLYFASKLPGIIANDLDISGLLFYAINAYSSSTINKGVGGTPRICIVNSEKSNVLSYEESILIGNLSGVYLSEICDELNSKKTISLFSDILKNEINEKNFCKDFNYKFLKSVYVTPSSWQEKSNKLLFD